MSGLLQRLAARAAGTAWAVQSDARLPFAAHGAPRGETAPAQQEGEVSPLSPGTRAPRDAGTRPGQAMPAEHPSSPRSPAATAAATDLAPPAARRPSPQEQAAHTPPGAPAPPQAVHGDSPSLRDRTAPLRPVPRAAAFDAAADAPGAPPASVAHAADPQPLRPSRATAKAASATAGHAPASIATGPAATAPSPAEPTEVHVHIGRIEVTAVHAPAPRPRAVRERAQPLSLDAYLAKRQAP